MFGVKDGVDCAAQLRLTPYLIYALDLAELFPGGRHQLFLLSLDHLRTQCGDCAMPRIEIQFVQPG